MCVYINNVEALLSPLTTLSEKMISLSDMQRSKRIERQTAQLITNLKRTHEKMCEDIARSIVPFAADHIRDVVTKKVSNKSKNKGIFIEN